MRNSLSLPDRAYKAPGTNYVVAMTEKMELTRYSQITSKIVLSCPLKT